MNAVDTNILVYAHRREFREHEAAHRLVMRLADGPELWGIPVFCVGEFLRVVTHPSILQPPTDLATALRAIAALLQSPSLRVLLPGEVFLDLFREAVERSGARGNLVFDAEIVAVCRENGVSVLWSNDRDFAAFAGFVARALEV